MLNAAFDEWGDASVDLYPGALRGEIDAVNALVYPAINNGVYRAGFATSQAAYEEAFHELFAALDTLEQRLSRQRYLTGGRLTEADWRLFTTLVRFDPVYVGHFKCNLRRIADYPNLSNYLRDLFQVPGVAAHGEHAPHQGPLLRQPHDHQSDAHRAGRARNSTIPLRTTGRGLPEVARPNRQRASSPIGRDRLASTLRYTAMRGRRRLLRAVGRAGKSRSRRFRGRAVSGRLRELFDQVEADMIAAATRRDCSAWT